ncbi:MAG: UDP-glucuronosyltransferase 2B31-like isoform 1 [Trebouxia sp. A1-2]|nr:MAG: UDP-glucuronosyltransferase 2B31-like isoform 1 [Trebouxia sp. A1-2]
MVSLVIKFVRNVYVVFTPGSATRFGPALTELPNVEIVTYNTSNVEELDLRQAIREGQRSVGFESIRSTFGMPLHSHPLLQDVELHRNIQAFKPDLALIDFVLAGGGALADKLGIPKAINCITGVVPPVVEHAYGSGASLLSSVPQWMSLAPRKMTFLQRVNNMVAFVMNLYCWQCVIEPQMDKIFWRQYDIAPYSYFKSNRQAALVLLPSDWANAEPLAPHMVTIGAITAAPAKVLPSELEEFMQSAGDHDVVYASLGTTAIPEVAVAPKAAPTASMRSGPAQILRMPGMQGPYHGVPLVGMPLFAEQPDNIARATDRGFALSVSVKKLDTLAKDLEQAIRRLLDEPSFAVSAAKVSHLMKAPRETPAQLAASAIEHAAWTKGERHMQPLRDDQNWFQTNSLDVTPAALH